MFTTPRFLFMRNDTIYVFANSGRYVHEAGMQNRRNRFESTFIENLIAVAYMEALLLS